ncbi:NHL repeat-containing protein [Filimonas effusa]|uniref:ATP/GTP-binding protein n=1 Tax=Filimonas effusa TaxID=2508721 RepID=A0A4Q1DCV7_9BACT|nr:ATP/GTP-binding protein [Filimonas effusa]RXK87200.1 ATP/GTP-binding protein [Filimonas effusa]
MKPAIFVLAALLSCFSALHAQRQLHEIWATDTVLNVPESVLYDASQDLLFVSLIGGLPNLNNEGRGSIGKLSTNGKIIDTNWVKGLNAPKGMAKFRNTLYVTDANEVAVIDIKKGIVTQKIPIPGAVFLNDITVDNWGIVYVSDSRLNKIHRIEKGQVSLYLDNVDNVNGLLAVGEDLYAVSAGRLLKISADKKITTLATGMEKSTDGLVQIAPGEFIISSWIGVIYNVFESGKVIQLTDYRSAKINTADLGYHPKKKVLYVPTFWNKRVIAFDVAGK